MVVDTSALFAVLFDEAGATGLRRAMLAAQRCLVPAPVYLELSMVFTGRVGADRLFRIDDAIGIIGAEIFPFSAEHAHAAQTAFVRYGKGRHPARLNFGDCMAYAVAKVEGLPLLWVGGDFGLTDVAGVTVG